MTEKLYSYIFFLAALIFSALPYVLQGYPLGDDSISGLVRIKEYQLAFSHRQIPPYWAENLYGGYGSPIFLFYAPLFMWVATVFYVITGSLISSSILATLLFTAIAAIGVFLLVLEILGENSKVNHCSARIAAYLFILNPYLISDKFIRNANSEYTALCLAPFALYGLIKIRRNLPTGRLILSGGLAFVILAHNLTALSVFALLLCLLPLINLDSRNRMPLYYSIQGIVLGLLIALFFWLPALYYKPLIHTEQLTQGNVNFRSHFKSWYDLFDSSQFYSMSLLNFWILVQAALILHREAQRKNHSDTITISKLFLFFALVLIFLQTELSLGLWENIPYLSLFQFPWRMMGPLALVIAVLAGSLFPIYLSTKNAASLVKIELTFLCLISFNALPILAADFPTSPTFFRKLTTFLESNSHNQLVFTSTEMDEYLPKRANVRLKHFTRENSPLILHEQPDINAQITQDTGTEILLTTESTRSSLLELKRWYFPGWRAQINNLDHPVDISDRGLLSIRVPSGHNTIKLTLHPPRLRQISVWISLSAFIFWLVLAIGPMIKINRPFAIKNPRSD